MCLTFLRKWHESMASDVTSGALHGDQMGAGVRRGGTGLVARALHDVRQQMAAGIRLKVVARHQIRCLLTAAAASGAKLVATLCCRAAASFPPDHCLMHPDVVEVTAPCCCRCRSRRNAELQSQVVSLVAAVSLRRSGR